MTKLLDPLNNEAPPKNVIETLSNGARREQCRQAEQENSATGILGKSFSRHLSALFLPLFGLSALSGGYLRSRNTLALATRGAQARILRKHLHSSIPAFTFTKKPL
jgi:hypothetical protein